MLYVSEYTRSALGGISVGDSGGGWPGIAERGIESDASGAGSEGADEDAVVDGA